MTSEQALTEQHGTETDRPGELSVTDATPPVAHAQAAPVDPRRLRRLVAAFSAFAFLFMAYLDRDGGYQVQDSVAYVGLADNLADGKGFTLPVTQTLQNLTPLESVEADGKVKPGGWPPLYGTLLAFGPLLGSDPVTAAGPVNALLFAMTVGGAVWIASRMSGTLAGGAAVGILLLVEENGLYAHHYIGSDGPLAALSVLTIVFVFKALDEKGVRNLAFATLFCALAMLTRLPAIALGATGGLAFLLWTPGPVTHRLRRVLLFGVGGVAVPVALLYLVGSMGSGGLYDSPSWHPPGMSDLEAFNRTVIGWFVSPGSSTIWRAVVMMGVLAATLMSVAGWLARLGDDDGPARRLAGVTAMFALLYTAVIWASSAFVATDIVPDERYLVPLQPFVLALWIGGIGRYVRWRRARLPALGPVLCALVVVMAVPLAFGAARPFSQLVQVNPDLETFPTTRMIRSLPEDALIFSTNESVVYAITGRPNFILPSAVNRASGQPNERLQQELDQLDQLVQDHDVVFVYYHDKGGRVRSKYLVPPNVLVDRLGLEVVADEREATIYAPAGQDPIGTT